MQLNYKKTDDIVLIYLKGHLDIYITGQIEKKIIEVISANPECNLIINLTDVDYVSSAGLGVFISIMSKLKKSQRKLALCSLNYTVRRIFNVVKFYDMFDVFKTEIEAIEFLKNKRAD